MEPKQVLPLRVRVNRWLIAMNEYSMFSIAPEKEPHHQMQFNVISKTHLFCVEEFYPSARDTVSVLSALPTGQEHPESI